MKRDVLSSLVLSCAGGVLIGISSWHWFDRNPSWIWITLFAGGCIIFAIQRLCPNR